MKWQAAKKGAERLPLANDFLEAVNIGMSEVIEDGRAAGDSGWDWLGRILTFELPSFHHHRNYGGPGYGAGKAIAEKDLTAKDFDVPPGDSRDACYQEHDKCFNNSHKDHPNGGLWKIVHDIGCDWNASGCLITLDPSKKTTWYTMDQKGNPKAFVPAPIEAAMFFGITPWMR